LKGRFAQISEVVPPQGLPGKLAGFDFHIFSQVAAESADTQSDEEQHQGSGESSQRNATQGFP
jgi:hypothetical protein